jgi:hypothetical protein
MPLNIVKNKRQEKYWNIAKQAVEHTYPKIKKDSDEYFQRVNGIYQNILEGKKK